MKILGLEYAPLFIPFKRRLQTLAVLGWVVFVLGGALFSWIFFIWAVFNSPIMRIPCILYASWMYYDRGAIESGTRRSQWVRNWKWWQYFTDYFPVKLVKTADLPTDRSYLFTVFPHGILSIGPFCSFSTDTCNIHKIFPGITMHAATLNMHFITPFIREVSLAMGNKISMTYARSIPASESCLRCKLSKKGNAVCLVVGGAEEAFYSKPGKYKILVAKRKGFIRIALKTGAALVPTISFGEPEVYDQIQCEKGSFLRWTQDWYKKITGVAPVYLKGRGIFQYTYGLLPFRSSITVVTGMPIIVTQVENPTQDQIDKLHKIYTSQLHSLFEEHKMKYLNGTVNLEIIPNNKKD